ncbi:MAG: diguanylate cyclase [Gemmatimonadetes bacterium]|nr:diguanylate cyclase [Gemmatimonadota bacterium]MCB9505328.1 diguanylate cyclase [Gemmatimonadales bacterium]MCA9762266.1 diguanylate cyclase [Gemmatimonadota bacterium]MCB9518036.1 diguanylate cyclase [Gemmatimonadales bacterium]HPF60992.1 diguanylate cyclase [Gemmatimonadales bacterium]
MSETDSAPFDGAVDDPILQLQWEYIREAPERLAELRKDLAAFRVGEPDALDSLKRRFHKLAGSGGSYGLPRVTEIARAAEQRILTPPRPTPQDADLFEQAITDLKDAFDASSVMAGMPSPESRLPGFGYRAILLMGPGPLRNEIERSLGEVGFVVAIHESEVDPWSVPPTERPDLVVIGTDLGENPLALARYWAAATPDRPRAVVLADPAERYDRLRTAAAGVDAVFGPATLPRGLAQYARALATIGAPPAHVVVVEDDPSQAQLFATWLGQINARVSICGSAQVARDTLLNETPDLVLLDVDLPDVDGFALARLMRQDPRLALVPVVFLTARQTVADELEGLRAGGDDFLAKPVERSHLVQVVLTRTERGRRIRELVHRDGLTGVLNHATLMAELDHAIAFASRHGEPVCFLMCDLDHFKRINDSHGHLVGDQVLMHVARVFRGCVRGSDLLGRYGGEEFGIILRRCPPANGKAIAEKLRKALEESPMQTRGGPDVSIRVSIGVATYPGSGQTAGDVATAADQALYRAKSAGRNRVEMG